MLRNGVTTGDVAVHRPRTGVVGAPAKRRSAKKFLPTTWWEWAVVALLVIAAGASVLFLGTLLVGWLSGGRFGAVGVIGNSMASAVPNGSTVLVVPLQPEEGNYAIAWVGAPDNMDGSVEGDETESLVVKKYTGDKLVSTDDSNTYSNFELRGKVVYILPTQKIMWWRDVGAQNGVEDLPTEAEKIDAKLEASSSQAIYRADLRKAMDKDLAKNKVETSLELPLELGIPLAGGETLEILVSAEKDFSALVLWDFMAEDTEVFVALPGGEKISTQNFSRQGVDALVINIPETTSCKLVVTGMQGVPGGITSLAGITVRTVR